MCTSISKTRLVVIGSLIALLTTGCGTSKVAQCSSFTKVFKESDAAAKIFDSPDVKNPDKSAQIFNLAAAKSQEISREFQSLDLQDKKLKGFQSKVVALYEEYGKSFSQISLAAKTKDAQAFNQPIAEVESGAVKEKALLKELTEYCSGQ